ncbi:MAG: phosphoesterase [Gemmatimonadetes bacterium]|nr:phosphoesterase [Gemmatimonadota bacterium]
MPDRRLSLRPSTARVALAAAALSVAACGGSVGEPTPSRAWIAGDHHIHSRFSVGWDREQEPPAPIVAGDAIYPIPMNALMAKHYGLSWMVATDHGGPNHSRVNLEIAYPELLVSREVVPEVVQFFGMEFDSPGADHSSMIMPHSHDEADHVHEIESRFSRNEPWPADPAWNTEPRMLEALRVMDSLPRKPIVIANHPSRSARGLGDYGLYDPAELRDWNDRAPEVATGMAGAPGHQAVTIARDGSIENGARGGYARHPTMGGFDQMTARLGGFWDSMLGEGRRWWITANSDAHVNWREGGSDFWPGEYSKTYVLAEQSHDAILEGIRSGRIFVTLGDLVSEAWVTAEASGDRAETGGTLRVRAGEDVRVTIRVRDPEAPNHGGRSPTVSRIDAITGDITGRVADRTTDTNPTTAVAARFTDADWSRDGEMLEMSFVIENVTADFYLRVRGTNGDEPEPEPDPRGEDPWSDLWFYRNPVFVEIDGS